MKLQEYCSDFYETCFQVSKGCNVEIPYLLTVSNVSSFQADRFTVSDPALLARPTVALGDSAHSHLRFKVRIFSASLNVQIS